MSERRLTPWSLTRSLPREFFQTLLIALILAIFARTWVVQAFKIPTASMTENLLVGDHVLVNKFVYSPVATRMELALLPQRPVARGNVVVFRDPQQPGRNMIKRCVAVGGDSVEIRDKRLIVNDRAQDESYVVHRDPHTYPDSAFLHETLRYRDNFGPVQVPEGELFFLGDNRDESHDSRFWGTAPVGNVTGQAVLVYWSVETPSPPVDSTGDAQPIRDWMGVVERTRWERSWRIVR